MTDLQFDPSIPLGSHEEPMSFWYNLWDLWSTLRRDEYLWASLPKRRAFFCVFYFLGCSGHVKAWGRILKNGGKTCRSTDFNIHVKITVSLWICRAVGCRVICFLLIITVIILVNITRVWSNYIYCPTISFTATIPHLTSASQRRILMSVLWIRNLLLTISIIHNCPLAVARLGDK